MLSKLRISKQTIFLSGFLLATQFINGFSNVRNGFSPISFYWYIFALYWALGWWFITDSKEHRDKWTGGYLDTGMFLYIGWIIVIPYYLFKTRGWKAMYTIGLLVGITLGAYIEGAIFSLILNAIS